MKRDLKKELNFRAPAYPLITHDPYFSIWSLADRLNDEPTKHWTGKPHPICLLAKVDGKSYRLSGKDPDINALTQTKSIVTPTKTIYHFEGAGIEIILEFLSPVIPTDPLLFSEPSSYIIWHVRATDGANHDVILYYDSSAELVINEIEQGVIWGRFNQEKLDDLFMGSLDQPMLKRNGDDVRIDWGYLHVSAPKKFAAMSAFGETSKLRNNFIVNGKLPMSDDMNMPRRAKDNWIAISYLFELGKVSSDRVTRYLILSYDDRFSVEFLHRKLLPYWKFFGKDIGKLISEREAKFEEIYQKCLDFDNDLIQKTCEKGGENYAIITSLALRQCVAANKLVADFDGTPLVFSKENFSNGCMGTVDVIYPASPFFLYFNLELMKANLTPVLIYANSHKWKFPFAPHDLGQYPLANGQEYGGREETETNQMPVEESGDMIIMLSAIAFKENNTSFADKYWNLVSQWAEYLKNKGLDPEHQLCTDDFAGHLAHNVNLSVKAIIALECYSKMCAMKNLKEESDVYHNLAKEYVKKWIQMADDGDHYKLAFDKPGSWSQKYNLVWDELLELNLFPKEVIQKEIKFYLTKMNKYGLPLDSRKEWTKLDWILWTATAAEKKEDFEKIIAPIVDFLNDTPNHVPMTDFYWTHDGKHVRFQARSVIGGVFIKMLVK